MGAITVDTKNKTRSFASERCVGCGLCVVKCEKQKALQLEAVPGYTPPEIQVGEGVGFLSGLSGRKK
jgi:Fe-S-cluster-containing hydrogenase component 2